VREASAHEWPELLKQFPDHTVYHTLAWIRTIENVQGATPHLSVLDVHGEPAALWPIFSTRKGPLRILGSPCPGWCTAYLGPVFNARCDVDSALAAFLDYEACRRYAFFSCKVIAKGPYIDLAQFGFDEIERFKTHVIDLSQPAETLWSNLKSECRTRIRKARKIELEVKLEEDGTFLDDYWVMSQETFSQCDIKPPFSRAFLGELWKNLHAAGSVRVLTAFMQGERIASLFLPFDGHTLYYWSGGSFLRHRAIPAHNLLHWEAIAMGQQLGLRRYDFIGTEGGGGRFKRTFAPETAHVSTTWERNASPLIRVLKNQYQHYVRWKQKIKG
jgi:hypothetical protein